MTSQEPHSWAVTATISETDMATLDGIDTGNVYTVTVADASVAASNKRPQRETTGLAILLP